MAATNRPQTLLKGATVNAPQTIPRSTVIAALESLGRIDMDAAIVHITGEHISLEKLTGECVLWRRIVDECASCHAPEGRPHTDYCKAPAEVARRVADGFPKGPTVGPNRHISEWPLHEGGPGIPLPPLPDSAYPADAVDLADEHDQTQLDAIADEPTTIAEALTHPDAEVTEWVDNGCRCPNPDKHMPGCPTLGGD